MQLFMSKSTKTFYKFELIEVRIKFELRVIGTYNKKGDSINGVVRSY